MSLKRLLWGAALSAALLPWTARTAASEGALSSQWGRYYVAAGLGEPGYQDGSFSDATFLGPRGLAESPDGTTLYVADTGNNAVRRVRLDQNGRVDTLFGGPSNSILISPTALTLSLDGKTLYVVDGKQNKVFKLPSDGGTASLVQATGLSKSASSLPATTLARHPSLDILYAWYAPSGSLYALDASKGQATLLGTFPELSATDATLVCTREYLFMLRSDSGELLRFVYNGRGLPTVGTAWGQGATALSWERLGVFGPGARSMVGVINAGGSWAVWIWDETHALFKQVDSMSGVVSDYPLRDYEGQWIMRYPPFPRTPFTGDVMPDATTRPLLEGPVALVADPARAQLYAAEANGNRVLGLAYPDWGTPRDDSVADYRSGDKIPGVTRILLLGDSMVLADNPDAGDHFSIETGFGKQFELYLNLFSALKGKNRRFQVLQNSVALGALGGGVTSYLANLPPDLQALNPDEVVTLINYSGIHCELLGMSRTKSPNDACEALVDPFYFAQSKEEMVQNYGPIHRDFLKWLKTAPPYIKQYVDANADDSQLIINNIYNLAPFQYPEYRAWVLKVQAKVSGIAASYASAHHMRYIQILLPLRNQLAPGENGKGGYSLTDVTQPRWIDADLAKIAASQGIEFLNLTKPMQLIEPTVFPMVGYAEQHYSTRGLHWAALLAAWQYVEKMP